jgi:hypothetical protein
LAFVLDDKDLLVLLGFAVESKIKKIDEYLEDKLKEILT